MIKSVKRLNFRLFVALLFLALAPLTVQAQDSREQELERKVQERDKVILELLERVEALERRVGVAPISGITGRRSSVAGETGPLAEAGEKSVEVPESGPGKVVVKQVDTERALERSLTRAGALLLSPGVLEIEPSLSYARQEDSSPSLVMPGDQLLAAETELNADIVTADLELRLGLPWDSQLEIGLPYRWRQVESINSIGFMSTDAVSQSATALGDIRFGLAKTLLREGLWRPDLIGRVTWDTSTGELEENGVYLGGGFNELRGSLTAIKRQDPLAVVGGLAYEYSFEESQIKPGQTFAANFGTFIALSPETSMRFIFAGAYQDESSLNGDAITGSDQILGTFVVGGTTLLAPGLLLNVSVNIGLTGDADDFGISVSLPFRFHTPLY